MSHIGPVGATVCVGPTGAVCLTGPRGVTGCVGATGMVGAPSRRCKPKILYRIYNNPCYNIHIWYCYEYDTQYYFQLVDNQHVLSYDSHHYYYTVLYDTVKSNYDTMVDDYEQYMNKWFVFYAFVKTDGVSTDVFSHMLTYYVDLRLYDTITL